MEFGVTWGHFDDSIFENLKKASDEIIAAAGETHFFISEYDILRDEAKMMVKRMEQAKVKVTATTLKGKKIFKNSQFRIFSKILFRCFSQRIFSFALLFWLRFYGAVSWC